MSDQPMLARRQLRLAVLAAVQPVCQNVFSPGNWPTAPESLPVLKVNIPTERKASKGRNVVQFDTTVSVVIQGQIDAATPEAAQDAIDDLAYQVEEAVLKDYTVNSILQQIVGVQTEVEITSDGKRPLAGFRMTIDCEMFESFDPTAEIPPASLWPQVPNETVALTEVNLHTDTVNVFDATGVYPDPEFPTSVQSAPRTSGPDGRDEGALQIILPQ